MLPPHLHSVMGSANLSLARGEKESARELCMEVIRQGTPTHVNEVQGTPTHVNEVHNVL